SGEEAGGLRGPAEPEHRDLVRAPAVNRPAAELDGAGPGFQIAHDRSQGRRLAGTVAPDEAHHVARADVERHAAQDLTRLDEDVDAGEAQHAGARGRSAPRPMTVSITRRSARIVEGGASARILP